MNPKGFAKTYSASARPENRGSFPCRRREFIYSHKHPYRQGDLPTLLFN